MKQSITLLAVLASVLVGSSFAQEKTPPGAALLIKLEADFAKAVAEHGHDAFITFFAEDGVELEDGGGVTTKEAMRKQPPWPEGTLLTWTPVKADMAASEDLGYTYGDYVLKSKDKEGKAVVSYGKYVSVWKKQKDGSWKVTVDMGNSSPEPKQ